MSIVFNEGEKVICPFYGVGIVGKLIEEEFDNEKKQLLPIRIKWRELTILIPVENIKKFGIRNMISKEKAIKILNELIKDVKIGTNANKKTFYNTDIKNVNKETNFDEVAKLITDLILKKNQNKMPVIQKKSAELYEWFFANIIAEALEVKRDEIIRVLNNNIKYSINKIQNYKNRNENVDKKYHNISMTLIGKRVSEHVESLDKDNNQKETRLI